MSSDFPYLFDPRETILGRLQRLKQIHEVLEGVEPIFLCRFHHAVDGGTCLCATGRVGKKPILSPDDKGFNSSFREQ
jgi:hypothetical protein